MSTAPDGREDLGQIRRDVAADWASVNPVLAAGELGYDTTNDILKVGDGTTAWADLPGYETTAVLDGRYAPIDPPGFIVPPASTMATSTPATHQIANRGFGMRFHVQSPGSYRYVNILIGTSSGNIEVAILKRTDGTLNQYTRVVSSGIIACPTSGKVRVDLGATELAAGDYWLGFWADNTTVTYPCADRGSAMSGLQIAARLNSNASGFGASGTWDDTGGGWCVMMSLEASTP